MSNNMDDRLEEQFTQLKQDDADRVPVFEETWNAAERSRWNRRISWYASAAAVVIMLGVSLFMTLRQSDAPVPTMSITEWESPTLALLETPEYGIPGVFPTSTDWLWQGSATARQDTTEAANME